jgi:hypothetical protein
MATWPVKTQTCESTGPVEKGTCGPYARKEFVEVGSRLQKPANRPNWQIIRQRKQRMLLEDESKRATNGRPLVAPGLRETRRVIQPAPYGDTSAGGGSKLRA